MAATAFTTAPFVRSHGREPRGRGSWAFQLTTSNVAFEKDLVGEIFWAPQGTLGEAKRAAREHFGPDTLVAVLS